MTACYAVLIPDSMPIAQANMKSMIAIALLCGVLMSATCARNRLWHTKLFIWLDTAKKSPVKERVQNNLGNCYLLLGMEAEAIEAYKMAIALDSTKADPYYNIAMSLENIGRAAEAIPYYSFYCKNGKPNFRKPIACERYSVLSQLNRTSEQSAHP
jgi:tetratricopeptide (TPR) repeat protein